MYNYPMAKDLDRGYRAGSPGLPTRSLFKRPDLDSERYPIAITCTRPNVRSISTTRIMYGDLFP